MCHIAHLRKHHKVDEEKTPIIYLMRIEWPFILKTWIPFVHAKDAMFQLWLKLTLRFFKLRRRILRYLVITPPPLGNGQGPSFQQTWVLITQGCFVPSLVEIGPVVLVKKSF